MLDAATWAARARGQQWFEERWEKRSRSPAFRRATTLLRRVAREVLDLALQARLERCQNAMHVPRDPVPPDPASKSRPPLSLQEIVSDRLGESVCGKTVHKAARLLEQLAGVEIYFLNPNDPTEMRHKKPKTAFSKKYQRRDGTAGTFYRWAMQIAPTNDLLVELEAPDVLLRVREYVPHLAALAELAAAGNRRESATAIADVARQSLDIGTTTTVQEARPAPVQPHSVHRGGAPPLDSGPPASPDGPDLSAIRSWKPHDER